MEEEKNNQEMDKTVAPSDTPTENNENVDVTTEAKVSEPTTGASESSKRNLILGILFALAVLVAGYFLFQKDGSDIPSNQQASVFVPIDESAEVARVNGVSLYGNDLTLQMAQAAQLAGIPNLREVDTATINVIQSQSLDAIINTKLISQASQAGGNTATPEEVDAEFASLSESIGGAEVATERLAELGVTVEEFKENLVDDILIRKYIESAGIDASLVVSEEEIQAFYDEVTGGQVEGMPTLEEAHAQIEGQILSQKQQEILLTLIEELRAGANIEILI